MEDAFGGKTLLIVEDEADLRAPLVQNFESLGCKVLEAENGKAGLGTLHSHPVDVVLSDIRMPGGDGIELLRNMTHASQCPAAAVLMTGYADFSREEAYQLGAQAIVAKPFDLDAIEDTLARVMTPLTDRWDPLATIPESTFVIRQEHESLELAVQSECLGVGRGGIFLRMDQELPAVGRQVALHFSFRSGPVRGIDGLGIVRWSRLCLDKASPRCYGIEFVLLSKQTRADLRQLRATADLQAYIPNEAKIG